MSLKLVAVIVLCVGTAHAEPRFDRHGATWELTGGLVFGVPPGPGISFGAGGFVTPTLAIGGRASLFVSIDDEAGRMLLGPYVQVWLAERFAISAVAGYTAVPAKTLHSSQTYDRWGGALRLVGAFGRGPRANVVGFELSYLPETRVYRDLYEDVGGLLVSFVFGYQRL